MQLCSRLAHATAKARLELGCPQCILRDGGDPVVRGAPLLQGWQAADCWRECDELVGGAVHQRGVLWQLQSAQVCFLCSKGICSAAGYADMLIRSQLGSTLSAWSRKTTMPVFSQACCRRALLFGAGLAEPGPSWACCVPKQLPIAAVWTEGVHTVKTAVSDHSVACVQGGDLGSKGCALMPHTLL